MNSKKIFDRLTPIFHDVFDDDEIVLTESMTAKDIEDWDSFAQIRLIAAIEKEFKIKFSFNEVSSLKNVGEMVALILAKIEEN